MAIRSVRVLSRAEVELFHPTTETALISITDPGLPVATLHPPISTLIRLQFFDLTERALGLPRGFLPDMGIAAPVEVDGETLPDARHAQQIVEFLRGVSLLPEPTDLVVHCEAGVCRSTAVADYARRFYGAPVIGARNDLSRLNQRLSRLLTRVHTDRPLTQFTVTSSQIAAERDRRRLKLPKTPR